MLVELVIAPALLVAKGLLATARVSDRGRELADACSAVISAQAALLGADPRTGHVGKGTEVVLRVPRSGGGLWYR